MKKLILAALCIDLFSGLIAQNVGIGNTNPAYRLDVSGRMRVRTGTLNDIYTTAGIWFDDFRQGEDRIFMGMQDSIRWGIYGNGSPGTGWAFNFNARNGRVGIGISEPGERLEVNGFTKAEGYKYHSPQQGIYSIAPASFKPENANDYSIFYAQYAIQGAYLSSSARAIVAPVNLPQGAVINLIHVYVYDNSSANIGVSLFTGNATGLLGPTNAIVSSGGTPGTTLLIDNSINYMVKNHDEFLYFRAVPFDGDWSVNLRVLWIKIFYTLTEVAR